MSLYLHCYNKVLDVSHPRVKHIIYILWLLKHAPDLNFYGMKSAMHYVVALWPGPCWKQACHFISLLETWAQLSSLIALNKLKGGHCWYGYCCDKLTSKRQTQLLSDCLTKITTPSSTCTSVCLNGHKSWLLVAKHNHSCNVDGAAVEGASLQVR